MSEAYERERYESPHFLLFLTTPANPLTLSHTHNRQNNSRLDELSSKVSALRGVTVDIYDNARSQEVIDHSVGPFHSLDYIIFSIVP